MGNLFHRKYALTGYFDQQWMYTSVLECATRSKKYPLSMILLFWIENKLLKTKIRVHLSKLQRS
jgi:hypothetical protein